MKDIQLRPLVHMRQHLNETSARTGLIACAVAAAFAVPSGAAEVIGYYPGWRHDAFPVTAAHVDAGRLTMALYAFADVCWNGKHGNPEPSVNFVAPCQEPVNGALAFRDEAADGANLRALVALKKAHPAFKVVLSVGGWDWSNRFSNVAASSEARANFVTSAVKTMRRYGLDGLDIDWEYPGEAGVPCVAGETCARPEDRQNFIALVRELRSGFDAAGRQDRKHYGITVAAGGNANYVGDGEWVKELARSLDWINIMAYDYHAPWEKTSGHDAPLFADPKDPALDSGAYASASVERYLKAGVDKSKLVLGVPFYSHGWKGCEPGPDGDGQYQRCSGGITGGIQGSDAYGFNMLLQAGMLTPALEGGNGYKRYWNAAAHVPYLYNAGSQVWISYDDPRSLRDKAHYARQRGLRGVMFWELSDDDAGHQMLRALSGEMGRQP